jgi:amidophosphoribosyltransferase
MRSLREECGVVGIFGDPDAANLAYLGLHALQHRGQEAFGIVSNSGKSGLSSFRNFGLVSDGIDRDKLASLQGSSSIGHVRYSTFGGKNKTENIQPFVFKTHDGSFALCHNGNLTNADEIKSRLEREGSIFHSSSDTEVFMHLLAKTSNGDLVSRLSQVMGQVKGAYSLLVLAHDRLIGLRDPYGFRPLVLGKKAGSYLLCSETCALDLIEAEYVRDVRPGEIIEISQSGIRERQTHLPAKESFCSFESIYFARPDSRIDGNDVYTTRKKIGSLLATEAPIDADVCIAIPDSGVAMALGYAETSGLPYELGLVRNHYIGRTFIEPSQAIRDFGVKLKLNPLRSVLQGKRVVVVDDSIVRGTTSIKIVRMLRQAGAAEVHMRIGSPPITHSCYFGVDTPDRKDLVAAQKSVIEIKQLLGADSLAFLSVEGLRKALNSPNRGCFGCFTGNYPEDICRQIERQPTDGPGPGLIA